MEQLIQNQPQFKTLDEIFNEFNLLYYQILYGVEPCFTEADFIGSRGSGKTHCVLDFLIDMFLMNRKNIIYIFRENESDLENIKSELFPKLEERGFIVKQGVSGNYNGKLNTVNNGYNKIIFKALNAEKMDVSKGKGAGLPVWKTAENIFAFFEEATQIDKKLVDIAIQGLRGNFNTRVYQFFCANPWSKLNWYVKKCNDILLENRDELLKKGFQKRFYFDDKKQKNVLFVRNNIYTNPYLAPDLKAELESYKYVSESDYNICCLGVSGMIGDLVYPHASKMSNPNWELINSDFANFAGGVDLGDGGSTGASATVAVFGNIDLKNGVDIIADKTWWNNKEKADRLGTTELMGEICDFYIEKYKRFKKPFKVWVDNQKWDEASAFNAEIEKKGFNVLQIEFVNIVNFKNKYHNDFRVRIMNLMIGDNLVRIDKTNAESTYNAFLSATWENKKKHTEDETRRREHSETHWLHATEYMINYNFNYFRQRYSLAFK